MNQLRIQGKELPIYPEHPVRVVCLEHLERELDDYVDKYEVAPDTFALSEVDEPGLSHSCMVCGAEGKIVLLHVKGM
ncbi:CxxH/CxxC protein [Brevibacillus sp. SYP-B805]|uniref:CxxH/CxxC protein n=1 Tax=Brevibacillus sp. SYP-B805 TaxID=1578199 RepID=UPI0013EBFF50|nr:CxxH/CxxC protein [Brevibacillus sp. SYP-B805]NGQ96112.1 CxxH/CxxC protein [Brevibacillus sp. SYP-B805]